MSNGWHINPETLTRGITYLYRYWLQAELNIVAEAYVRRAGESILITPKWALMGSSRPVDPEELNSLEKDLGRPIFVVCTGLPEGACGYDIGSYNARELPPDIEKALMILDKYQDELNTLGEESSKQDEWWKTRDAGSFMVWKGRGVRLLLYPTTGSAYGYTITKGKDSGLFLYRSRSCKEEGKVTREGRYKASEHAISTGRKVQNLDLLFNDESVLLVRLHPAGAGYKVFPRRVVGEQGSLI